LVTISVIESSGSVDDLLREAQNIIRNQRSDIVIAIRICLAAMCALMIAANAFARDSSQWTGQDSRIRKWFEQLKQPDHPRVSCCGEADAYEADNYEVEGDHYIAIITGHRAVTNIPVGSRIPVPNRKMKFDAGNPTGHGIIFIDAQRRVLCYVTPAAG
jgi:hypothetical protein